MSISGNILPATTISASGAGSAYKVGRCSLLPIMVNCSAVPTGGAPTLDVYLQHSCDEGANWTDLAHFQFTTSAAIKFWRISGVAIGPTSADAQSDAALAGDTVKQGPFGSQVRIKYTFAAGGSTGSYTLAVTATPRSAS